MRCLKEAILSMFNAMQSFLLFLFCILIILVLPECVLSVLPYVFLRFFNIIFLLIKKKNDAQNWVLSKLMATKNLSRVE